MKTIPKKTKATPPPPPAMPPPPAAAVDLEIVLTQIAILEATVQTIASGSVTFNGKALAISEQDLTAATDALNQLWIDLLNAGKNPLMQLYAKGRPLNPAGPAAAVDMSLRGKRPSRCAPMPGIFVVDFSNDELNLSAGIVKSIHAQSKAPFLIIETIEGLETHVMLDEAVLPPPGSLAERVAKCWQQHGGGG